jgi:hypothetical protein
LLSRAPLLHCDQVHIRLILICMCVICVYSHMYVSCVLYDTHTYTYKYKYAYTPLRTQTFSAHDGKKWKICSRSRWRSRDWPRASERPMEDACRWE